MNRRGVSVSAFKRPERTLAAADEHRDQALDPLLDEEAAERRVGLEVVDDPRPGGELRGRPAHLVGERDHGSAHDVLRPSDPGEQGHDVRVLAVADDAHAVDAEPLGHDHHRLVHQARHGDALERAATERGDGRLPGHAGAQRRLGPATVGDVDGDGQAADRGAVGVEDGRGVQPRDPIAERHVDLAADPAQRLVDRPAQVRELGGERRGDLVTLDVALRIEAEVAEPGPLGEHEAQVGVEDEERRSGEITQQRAVQAGRPVREDSLKRGEIRYVRPRHVPHPYSFGRRARIA